MLAVPAAPSLIDDRPAQRRPLSWSDQQAAGLRAGGVVVPIELDLHSARSLPSTPLVTQALSWLAGRSLVGDDSFQQRLSDELTSTQAAFAHPILMSAGGTTQPAK